MEEYRTEEIIMLKKQLVYRDCFGRENV